MTDPKADLHSYLKEARAALLWKLDGLSEFDIRRPMTPSGTNLLGLVKHIASVADGYFGDTFDRPSGIVLPWFADDAELNADMWARGDETREYLLDIWAQAWRHSDATIEALPLDAIGHVPWWPADRNEVTLHQILCHMVCETARHAGHADILRESIDNAVGVLVDRPGMAVTDEQLPGYVAMIEQAARDASR